MAGMDNGVMGAVIESYVGIGVPTDRLPYTADFDRLYEAVVASTGCDITRAECWRLVTTARKRGKLPRLRD